MDRRSFFTMAGVCIATLAGCSSGESEPADLSVDLDAEDSSPPDSTANLEASYSAEALTELPTDPPTHAEEEYKWLVVELSITNNGEERHDLSPSRYIIEADGEMYEYVITGEDWSLEGLQVEPGETVVGELPFHIPQETRDATLAVRDDVDVPRPITITFSPSE